MGAGKALNIASDLRMVVTCGRTFAITCHRMLHVSVYPACSFLIRVVAIWHVYVYGEDIQLEKW